MDYLDTNYQKFIHTSRYARWIEEDGRRESWEETVDRYIRNIVSGKVEETVAEQLKVAILKCDIMPSMRSMMTAGEAFHRDNTCGYNCSYLAIDDIKAFDEAMFILMCGAGVGFSVERQFITKLPEIPEKMFQSETTIFVKDSKEGWAKSLRQLVALLYSGEIPKWDVSKVRPAGERLKTFGGRASGPGPLIDLFQFFIHTFTNAKGRKLNSLECHDLMCKIGEIVVVGGVRRSAMISLSNLSDDRMRHAKSGQFPTHRYLANNSVAYTEKPDSVIFLREWISLVESGSGERGIFNREAAKKTIAIGNKRDPNHDFGTNPCGEIILRSNQFCNLTEVIIRANDDEETLKEKVRLATILGTIQASYTHFPYLRKSWKKNSEEEALLGVSLTGIMDSKLTNCSEPEVTKLLLTDLHYVAVSTNEEYAKVLGINPAAAVTTVKPSGTVSQLVNSASGIHARYAPYYIRRVRADNKDPLTQFMKDAGIPCEPCLYKGSTTSIFSFPIKSPVDSVMTKDLSAINQLTIWEIYKKYWTDHNPSVTIQVKPEEWFAVGAHVYKNFDNVGGLSFLPYEGHIYQQAPYEEISLEEFEELLSKMPTDIDWSDLRFYEQEDNTVSSQTYACSGSSCEIVDLTGG